MKKTTLEEIFKKKRMKYLSGEDIARYLGISRAGVWKQIRQLRLQGLNVEGKRKTGYRLITPTHLQNLSRFSFPGLEIQYFNRIGSTQTLAKKLALAGIRKNTLVLARSQFLSYGRMKREWVSPQGGLWFSLVLKPACTPFDAPGITLVAGLSVARVINRIAHCQRVQLKWPNDVLLNNKKVCGILTEMQTEMDRVLWVVIGIGINANNQVPAVLRNTAASIIQENGQPVNLSDCLRSVLKEFFKNYEIFITKGISYFINAYNGYSCLNGRNVEIRNGIETIRGVVIGIDSRGGLVLRTGTQTTKTVYSGEVIKKS